MIKMAYHLLAYIIKIHSSLSKTKEVVQESGVSKYSEVGNPA
jgi:hypothetical protein